MHLNDMLAAVLLVGSMAVQAQDSGAPPPALDFFRPEQLGAVKLSPSGRHLAATRHIDSQGRRGLLVMNLEADRSMKLLAVYQDADVAQFHWVGDEELVYSLTDLREPLFNQAGQGLFAVDREGRYAPRKLVKRSSADGAGTVQGQASEQRTKPREALEPDHRFFAVPRDGSKRVLVKRSSYDANWELKGTDLLAISLATGRAEVLNAGAPPRVSDWIVDDQGRARVVSVMAGAQSQLHWRSTPDAPWTLLREQPRYVDDGGLHPFALTADGTLFGVMRGSADTRELATLDTRQAGATPRSVVAVKGFDFAGQVILAPGDRALGVHVLSDAWGSHWFDAGLRGLQQAIDKALPNTVNLIDCGACDNPRRLVVFAFSDRDPGSYYLYDVEKQQLALLAHKRPWIPRARMGNRNFERIAARDGLELPLHFTQPAGSKGPMPTVLLVHGGPWTRGGSWRWDAGSQFLASRGYLVLEPEFRGSSGYGAKLSRAGFRQWGQAMQDDLIDALDWAVKQGLADPKRVCVMGGSYGGYATLMALVRHGERFRCGVEYMGVTDIHLMYESAWSDLDSDWKRFGMPELIGDKKGDAEMLAAHSPLQQAARIARPVLMAHGRQDTRVPLEHGTRMRDALKKHNAQVEWVIYDEEGHGWQLDRNEADFWTRVETFLGKHLVW